ncbi:MAG: tRNA (N(6)-L-threonylcarbamoyladenosine(37)-C(2))-methylthiotransferase [Candidatus Aenigmarchaeota archaeon]|nr:tRNA (N(6)-L-threonylcarbamoyladenosine(37)-C(2))-methylthiotransferase [Candidatus Aenigmarchaeota archaeon]
MPAVFIETFGCAANQADSEFIAGLLERAGFETAASPADADIVVLNTCIVKTPTENRIVRRMQGIVAAGKPLVIAGCMPKTSKLMIESIAPKACIVGPDSLSHIVDAAKAALAGRKVAFVSDEREDKPGLPRVRRKKDLGIVPIAIGCLGACSYCATKLARGKLKSYPVECVVAETASLVKDGCRKIWLTSEDNSCYGLDAKTNLAELIGAVSKVPGNFTIRVGMMNPTYIRDKKLLSALIEAYKNPKVSKFLHVPVQSGSDKILRAMKRGYTVADFEKIVAAFRKEVPGMYIDTDVIVGFPGETDEDFDATVSLLARVKPEKVNLSKFGARPGTEASKLKQLPAQAVSARSRAVSALQRAAAPGHRPAACA